MSYRIRPGEPLTTEVRRVAESQYASAIGIMRDQPRGPHEAIHDARKCFKRLRGLFRLLRDAAPEFSARENARVRDIARTLSEVRDATALVEALGDDRDLDNLEALIATDPDSVGDQAEIATLRAAMAARSAELHAQVRTIVKNLLRDDRQLVRRRMAALWRDAAG